MTALRPALRVLAVLAAIWALAGPAAALEERGTFAVSLAGIPFGVLNYEGREAGGIYETRGSANATGLAGAVFGGRVDTAANGRIAGGSFRPSGYSEVVTEGGERVIRTFRYAGGVPSISRQPPREKPRDHAAPPQSQGGTLDPMTGTWAILKSRAPGDLCDLDLPLYDGIRRTQLSLTERVEAGGGVTCRGRYVRIAGFSPEEMAERRVWPVEVDYVPGASGLMQVRELRFPTSFGNARLTRR